MRWAELKTAPMASAFVVASRCMRSDSKRCQLLSTVRSVRRLSRLLNRSKRRHSKQKVHQDEVGCDRMTSRRKRLVRKMLSQRRQTMRLLHGVIEISQCDQTGTTASLRDLVERDRRKYVVRIQCIFFCLGSFTPLVLMARHTTGI